MLFESDIATQKLVKRMYRIEGKAEIVGGKIVKLPFSGALPARAAGEIYFSLNDIENKCGGRAYGSTVAFLIDLPDRKSLCPDASFYIGPRWGMKFPEGAPVFAVEIREVEDYGLAFERMMADKRADYFAAGTKVVWDVDLIGDEVIRKYSANSTDTPTIYRKGQLAEAEPAVPGWTFPVDELFA